MLQKELAKRLCGRLETEMNGDGWLAASSDGMTLCRVKYNGNYIVNDTPTYRTDTSEKLPKFKMSCSP